MNNSRTHSAVQPGVALPAWGNQSSDRLSYDGVGRMITKRYLTGGINGATHAYNNTTALVGATTGYDRAGNKLYERHLESESRSHLYQPFNPDGSFGVGYDSANRLLQYQRGVLSSAIIPYLVAPGASVLTPTTLPGADQVRTYGLDGLGNWKNTNFSQVGSGGAVTRTAEMRQHNYVNEITQRRDTTGSTATTAPFSYDFGNNTNHSQGNGNLVNDGVRTYQYDPYNRLIQVSNASTGAVIATYVYDAFDRRIQKTINDLGGGYGGLTGDIPAGTTDYLYDGKQIVEERNNATSTVWTKVNFWGQYIDELMFFAVPTESAPATYRVLSDLLYRSVAIVTTDNVVTEAYDTDAYGNTLCYSGPDTDGLWLTNDDVWTNNPINTTIFTGRQFDPESQIYYYRARYYTPQWGRFISRDPIGVAGGINLYAYALNNPAKWVDPIGLIITCKDQIKSKKILNEINWYLNHPLTPIPFGNLAYDTDGGYKSNDPTHQDITSGAITSSGDIVPQNWNGAIPLNAGLNYFAAASRFFAPPTASSPADLFMRNGLILIGDSQIITFPNGSSITNAVGDYGHYTPEISVINGINGNNGLGVQSTQYGPIPTMNGSVQDIPVAVSYTNSSSY